MVSYSLVRAALVACVLVAAAFAAGATATGAGAPLLPDLVADPPGEPEAAEVYDFGHGDERLLVRFSGYVHNAGLGALEIRGGARTGRRMAAVQRVFGSGGGLVEEAGRPGLDLVYEDSDSHHHWHLRGAARYSLWNLSRSEEVAPAQKVGFCLADLDRREKHGPSQAVYTLDSTGYCEQYRPSASTVRMGISAGWRDVYSKYIYYQWIDASDVQPGEYWLRSDVDPDDVIRESDETNAPGWAARSTTVNGHLALPVDAGEVPVGGPVSIALAARTFDDRHKGSPGPRRFVIETLPAHGTLSVPAGQPLKEPAVIYTPHDGYRGPDAFTFSAQDADSPYPHHPARAAVTLRVGPEPEPARIQPPPAVVISGAPASMPAGANVQLSAGVSGAPSDVTWSVSPGGGTITAAGYFSAPLAVPRGGIVTVRATTPAGAFGEVSIAITPPAPERPAPSLAGPAPQRTPLAVLTARREGDALLVRTMARSAGRVTIEIRRGTRLVGRCNLSAPRLRPLVCKRMVPLPGSHGHSHTHRPATGRLAIVAKLTVRGRTVAVRRLRLGRQAHAH